MNITRRKSGSMNVRPTSSYKITRNHPGDRQCVSIDVADRPKSNGVRNEANKMPKTRFNVSTSWNTHTPRLKDFPVERVKKTVVGPDADTQPCNLTSHGNGDAFERCLVEELTKQPQQEGSGVKTSSQAVKINETSNLAEHCVRKINQSDAVLSNRVASPEIPIHRPFVPNVAHGMTVRDCSSHKSALSPRAAACHSFARGASQREEQNSEEVTSTANPEAKPPEQPASQQVSQISPQVDQSVPKTTRLIRDMIPWKTYEPPIVAAHEVRPTGGKSTATAQAAPVVEMQLDRQKQQPVSFCQEQSNPSPDGQWVMKQQQKQQTYEAQLQQRYQNQPSTVQTQQNPQQMYQQLQANIIHQQQMQQKALSHQQQMTMITQEQMRQQPLAPQSQNPVQQPLVNQTSYGNYYNLQHVYRNQPPQLTNNNNTNVPHYRVLMEERDTRSQLPMSSPQYGWVHNREVVGDHPSVKGQLKPFAVDLVSPMGDGVATNHGKSCEGSEHCKASMVAQQVVQEKPEVQWTARQSYPQYQQERQDSLPQQQASTIESHEEKTQRGQQQLQQQQQRTIKQFGPFGRQQVLQTSKKKYSEFTPEMIRDQELLVRNMRQQNIPEDIMKRQFDGLLYEQRRQLAYLNVQEVEVKIDEIQPRRNFRTSREDQRPDWMGRITPPRMTLQEVHNSRGIPQQRDTKNCSQDQRQGNSEQVQQKDQNQQEVIQRASDHSQYRQTTSHQLRNVDHQHPYHAWQGISAHRQPATGVTSTQPYSNASMPQMSTQNATGWSQDNFRMSCQHQLHPQPMQLQYQPQSQTHYRQMHENHPVNYQEQLQRVEAIPHDHREITMPTKNEGRCSSNSNAYPGQHGHNYKRDEATSLLKLKEFKQYIRPQTQFNGLQDTETVKAALDALKNPAAQKGLEYMAELEKKARPLKLNGTQDPDEVKNISPPSLEYLQRMQQQQQPKVSANGLCNTRNANNPPPRQISIPKNLDPMPTVGYPPQYYPSEKARANVLQVDNKLAAEKDNSPVQREHLGNGFVNYEQMMDRNPPNRIPDPFNGPYAKKFKETLPIMPYKFDTSESQYRQQFEQFHRNQLNLKKLNENNNAALAYRPGAWNRSALINTETSGPGANQPHMQPEAQRVPAQNFPDSYPQQKKCSTEKMVPCSEQPSMLNYRPRNAMEMINKGEPVVQFPTNTQRTLNNSFYGQPEIRVPRTIGGLTYLARNVDYIQNPPLITPNAFEASKFLQPTFG